MLSQLLVLFKSMRLPQELNWPRLQSLALKMLFSRSEDIRDGIVFLKDFHHLALKEVTVEVHEGVLMFTQDLARHAHLCGDLERTLLKFSQVRLVWVLDVFPIGRNSSRVQEIENRFPVLLQRGALAVVPNTGDSDMFLQVM